MKWVGFEIGFIKFVKNGVSSKIENAMTVIGTNFDLGTLILR